MEQWNSEYLDMDVPAYITIDAQGSGDFQFGLVCGQLEGDVIKEADQERFDFTWEGNDESDEAPGSGWLYSFLNHGHNISTVFFAGLIKEIVTRCLIKL